MGRPKKTSGESQRIVGLAVIDGELVHFQRLLIEHSNDAWSAYAKLPVDIQRAILEGGLLYADERRTRAPRALPRLTNMRLAKGLTYDGQAKAINNGVEKMLEGLNSTIMARYLGLRKILESQYTSTVDPTLLVEGESDTRQDFKKRAHCDGSTIRALESGKPEPIRPEKQVVLEHYFQMKLDQLLALSR